jgi:DNA-binding IscR family transcriptional regulator
MEQMTELILPEHAPKLKLITQSVLMLLVGYVNRKTGQCNPRISTMAARLGVHQNTVDRHLKRLYLVGLVKSTKGQRGNHYWVAPRDQWAEILRAQNGPAQTIPAGSNWACPQAQNGPAELPLPYMNLLLLKEERVPRIPPKKSTTPTHRRPMTMDERVVAAYYRMKKEREG